MQSQSRRRPILPYALTALVAGLALFLIAAAPQARAANLGRVAPVDYPPNDPPIASNFSVSATVGTSVTGMLGDHVVDPEHETLTFYGSTATKGTVTVDEITGQFTYTPNLAASGTDSFTYYAYDPQQNKSNDATVTVSINRRPTAANQSITVAASGVFNGQLQGSDQDGDTLTYTMVGQPTKGFVTLSANGSFTYVPNTGASGSDSFTYKVSDGKADSSIATVAVTIQPTVPANHVPSASNLNITATAGVAFNGQLQGSDQDGDTLTFAIVSQPSKGTLSLGTSGAFIYTPNATATGSDSFTYKVSDGKADSSIATVAVTIQPAAPVQSIYLPFINSNS